MDDHCDCHKTRVRSEEELKKLCNRLSRIEGQVRGLREMLGALKVFEAFRGSILPPLPVLWPGY